MSQKKELSKDLTAGPIAGPLIKLALPMVATNFMQTAYNLVDMIWIGKLGTDAVVSVGSAGFMAHLALSLFTLIAVGTGIRVAQKFGAKDYAALRQYIVNGYMGALVLGLLFSSLVIFFRSEIIGFFKLGDIGVIGDAENYLQILMYGTIFIYFNTLFSSIVNGVGNSKLPFRLNSIGFILNIILDPILIFGINGHFQYGVAGAGYATVISAAAVFLGSLVIARKMTAGNIGRLRFDVPVFVEVLKLGFPNTLQRVSFTLIGIIIARIIADLGPVGIGVQKIGLQVEALSYMTAGALYGAVVVFVGQNYGAKNFDRIQEGVKVSLSLALLLGITTTSIFLLFPRQIMSVFVSDLETVEKGMRYLQIIGLSQIFMCVEIVSAASFNGMGKTYIPATVGFSLTVLRIPLAIFIVGTYPAMGLDGVWWSISGTSMVKGVLLASLLVLFIRRLMRKKELMEGE